MEVFKKTQPADPRVDLANFFIWSLFQNQSTTGDQKYTEI